MFRADIAKLPLGYVVEHHHVDKIFQLSLKCCTLKFQPNNWNQSVLGNFLPPLIVNLYRINIAHYFCWNDPNLWNRFRQYTEFYMEMCLRPNYFRGTDSNIQVSLHYHFGMVSSKCWLQDTSKCHILLRPRWWRINIYLKVCQNIYSFSSLTTKESFPSLTR